MPAKRYRHTTQYNDPAIDDASLDVAWKDKVHLYWRTRISTWTYCSYGGLKQLSRPCFIYCVYSELTFVFMQLAEWISNHHVSTFGISVDNKTFNLFGNAIIQNVMALSL